MALEIIENSKDVAEVKTGCCVSDVWYVDPVDLG